MKIVEEIIPTILDRWFEVRHLRKSFLS
jgi:hypothetical protein